MDPSAVTTVAAEPWWGKVVTLLVGGLVTLLGTWAKAHFDKKRKKSSSEESTATHLAISSSFTDHPFFFAIKNAIRDIDNVRCGCDGRTALFRIIIRAYLTAWMESVVAFVVDENKRIKALEDEDSSTIPADDVRNQALHARVGELILAIDNRATALLSTARVDSRALPVFNRWWRGIREGFVDSNNSVMLSPRFDTDHLRLWVWLTNNERDLKHVVNNCALVCVALNGGLDDMHVTDENGIEHVIEHVPEGFLTRPSTGLLKPYDGDSGASPAVEPEGHTRRSDRHSNTKVRPATRRSGEHRA